MPGCRETRHPGIFSMCFCLVVPIIRFPGPAFPLCVYKARFHDVKQETCHGLQQLLHHLQAEDAECIFTSKMCELTNKYLEQLILSVASGELDDTGLLNWLQGHIE